MEFCVLAPMIFLLWAPHSWTVITSWRLTRDDFVVCQKYNHVQMHKAISDQNLELLRERLIQTVKLTSDGDNIDRPPMRGMDWYYIFLLIFCHRRSNLRYSWWGCYKFNTEATTLPFYLLHLNHLRPLQCVGRGSLTLFFPQLTWPYWRSWINQGCGHQA